ncbi:MAG: hypothetical protein GX094_03255 [Clostridiales bacterium]|nr:hypothetical protein [Clostridiales bacterium]
MLLIGIIQGLKEQSVIILYSLKRLENVFSVIGLTKRYSGFIEKKLYFCTFCASYIILYTLRQLMLLSTALDDA